MSILPAIIAIPFFAHIMRAISLALFFVPFILKGLYHRDTFLCRAICAELASEQVSLKEIIRARTRQRQHVRTVLHERTRTVKEALGQTQQRPEPEAFLPPDLLPEPPRSPSRLKRYINE